MLFFAPQYGARFWSVDARAKEETHNPTNNDTRTQTNEQTKTMLTMLKHTLLRTDLACRAEATTTDGLIARWLR